MANDKNSASSDPKNFFDNQEESLRFIDLITTTIDQYAEKREYLTVNEIVFALESIIANLEEAYGSDDFYVLGSK
ncbi:hypothetical protein ACFLT7_00720 [candidate division KSB1 bacterium]